MNRQLDIVYLDKIGFVGKLFSKMAGLFGDLLAAARRHSAKRELMQLDDRMLADIGLERSNIDSAMGDLHRR